VPNIYELLESRSGSIELAGGDRRWRLTLPGEEVNDEK